MSICRWRTVSESKLRTSLSLVKLTARWCWMTIVSLDIMGVKETTTKIEKCLTYTVKDQTHILIPPNNLEANYLLQVLLLFVDK